LLDSAAMKRIISVAAVISALGAAGCATVAEGEVAKPIDMHGQYLPTTTTGSGLVVHARELSELSSEDTGVVEVTLENTTHDWVRLESVRLDFETPIENAGVTVPDGPDLAAWHAAIAKRNAVRAENEETALALVSLAGAVGAAGSHAGGRRAVGAGVAVGAAFASGAAARDAAAQIYPDDHLFNTPIVVPPGLFATRWIALTTKPEVSGHCLERAVLDYDTSKHERERLVMPFRPRWNGSEWQAAACHEQLPHFTGQH
jgi:hypothetical protein